MSQTCFWTNYEYILLCWQHKKLSLLCFPPAAWNLAPFIIPCVSILTTTSPTALWQQCDLGVFLCPALAVFRTLILPTRAFLIHVSVCVHVCVSAHVPTTTSVCQLESGSETCSCTHTCTLAEAHVGVLVPSPLPVLQILYHVMGRKVQIMPKDSI